MPNPPTDKPVRLDVFELALLAVPAVWAPARLAANNLSAIPHFERLVALSFAVWVSAVTLCWLLANLNGRPRASTYAVFVGAILALSVGSVSRSIGTLSTAALIIVIGTLVFVLARSRESSVAIRAVSIGLSVALLAGPASDAAQSILAYGESDVVASSLETIEFVERPDIYMLILDGYPGVRSLAVAHGSAIDAGLVTDLHAAGFEIPESVWASYPSTMQSVSSLLQMSYPVTTWTDSDATKSDLYSVIGGHNELVRTLSENGYDTVMLESGWSGSSCGRQFDICSAPPIHDSAMDYILHESFLGAEPGALPGVSFAISTQSTMDQLLDLATDPAGDKPRFVFSHLLAPHPPFFLDAKCERSFEAGGAGFFFPYPGVDAATRDRLFARQLDCVDSFLSEFVSKVDPDAIVVLVADHGTGRRAQMAEDPSDWDEIAMIERMNPFLALRAPDGCSVGDRLVLPNVMRRILSCLGGVEVEDLPSRIFLSSSHELRVDEVNRLMGRSSS